MKALENQPVTNRPSKGMREAADIGLVFQSLLDIVSFPYPKRRDEQAIESTELPGHILHWEDDGGRV